MATAQRTTGRVSGRGSGAKDNGKEQKHENTMSCGFTKRYKRVLKCFRINCKHTHIYVVSVIEGECVFVCACTRARAGLVGASNGMVTLCVVTVVKFCGSVCVEAPKIFALIFHKCFNGFLINSYSHQFILKYDNCLV